MTTFWWIRHAPVVGNNDCCYGSNEVNCDISDQKKFKKIASLLPKQAKVFCSPLSRAIKTYEAVSNNGFIIKDYFLDDRLVEQNLGDWTGMKYKELEKLTEKLKVSSDSWLMSPKHTPPGGESFIDLKKRVKSFLKETIKNYFAENIIIFSHGGAIRAALSIALEYNEDRVLPVSIDNSSITRVSYYDKIWRVENINV